jgi:holo-[acyl-carrier protein] synthase
MLEIGIDIVKVERFERWLTNTGLLHRFFHERDLKFALSQGVGKAQSLAGRFAAKEAFIKALGPDYGGFPLKDIYVSNDGRGKPHLVLLGAAKSAFEESGAQKTHLSLTHEKDNAVAVVVMEWEES